MRFDPGAALGALHDRAGTGGHPRARDIAMNYETTIIAESAEPIEAEARGAVTERGQTGSGLKPFLWLGGVLFALLLAIAAYFAFAGGDPATTAEDE